MLHTAAPELEMQRASKPLKRVALFVSEQESWVSRYWMPASAIAREGSKVRRKDGIEVCIAISFFSSWILKAEF